MKILVFGANGFIGAHVANFLEAEYEVFRASRHKAVEEGHIEVDLMKKESIRFALSKIKPDILINCAGVLIGDVNNNSVMTLNILKEIVNSEVPGIRTIVLGSASEYGEVQAGSLPIKETELLNPLSAYGKSKKEEIVKSLAFAKENNLQVIIARLFNPVGVGMNPKQLIPSLLQQLKYYKEGKLSYIELSRLDSARDYIDVRDVASAIGELCKNKPKYNIYNIGSGESTSNKQIVSVLISLMSLANKPRIVELNKEREPMLAVQADITRLKREFNWSIQHDLDETLREVVYATR